MEFISDDRTDQDGLILDRTRLMLHAFRALSQVEEAQALPAVLENQVRIVLSCQQASFLRLQGRGPARRLIRSMDGSSDNNLVYPLSCGISGRVAREQISCICNDLEDDPHFDRHCGDVREDIEVENLMAVPVMKGNQIMGVLLAFNGLSGEFDEESLDWLVALAEQGGKTLSVLQNEKLGWKTAFSLARTLARLADEKRGTVGRSERMRTWALGLGLEMKLIPTELRDLELATLLVQTGGIHVPARQSSKEAPDLRRKSGRFSAILTSSLVEKLDLPSELGRVEEIVLAACRTGEESQRELEKTAPELSLPAHILIVVQTFERLTCRVDGEGRSEDEAMKILKDQADKTLDAGVVEQLERSRIYQIERRHFPRSANQWPMVFSELDEQTLEPIGDPIPSVTLDASESGLSFLSPKSFAEHTLIKIRVQLPSEDLDGFARVARVLDTESKNSFHVGVYILGYIRTVE